MIEDVVERTEKKVDLFFKILLGLKVRHIGHLYNKKYIDDYMDELALVYNLSIEKDIIDDYPTQKEIQNWRTNLNHESIKLKQDYTEGNFLTKEQDSIKLKIKYLETKLECISKLSENKEKFDDKNIEIYKINLFIGLQKKLGIIEEYDNYSYRKLVREQDNIKKNIYDLIEEFRNYMDNDSLDKKDEL